MEAYRTVLEYGEGVYEEKKSVFYASCFPVKTEEEALSHLAAEKRRYPDARHHVYAYILREGNLLRYSDDREPQGTAGMPVLDLLRKSGVSDVLVVVSRYFGGTLLGTGGLVRAYTASAKDALTAARIAVGEEMSVFTLSLSYGDYPRVQFLLTGTVTVESTDYADSVTVRGAIRDDLFSAFRKSVTEVTAGRAEPSFVNSELRLVPIEN